MGYRFDAADVALLRSAVGQEALDEVAALPLTDSSRLTDTRSARRLLDSRGIDGERFAAALLETAVLRRRAQSKFDDAQRWLFTDDALQQATASVVAEHRAMRVQGRDVHDVTCSIGADLAAFAAVGRRCIGSDMDSVRLTMAAHNLAVRRGAGHLRAPVALARADALRPITRDAVVFADPARRDVGGRRRWSPAALVPPLDELVQVHAGRDLAVKCAPGLDFNAVPDDAEVEVVSAGGTVREATLWCGGLADSGVRRRASVLGGAAGSWSISDAEPEDCGVRAPGEWIVDPDGAVVRAGLVRQYAVRHGLGQLDPHIAYLTGDAPPPGVRAFRVLDWGRYGEKALRALVRQHNVGRVEILVRGLDVDPDALRKRVKPAGSAEMTFVLTRIGRTPTFFACRATRT